MSAIMEEYSADALGEWESEGGAQAQSEAGRRLARQRTGPITPAKSALSGTVNQIDWAEQIKERVGKEFDRVGNALRSVAARQVERDQTDTQALIAILEDKRAEVMAHDQAGYFIREWQELGDRVRQMIAKDSRYGAVKVNQAA